MRLSPDEYAALFGTQRAGHQGSTGLREDSSHQQLLYVLVASLPKLWQHARAAGPRKTDQRRKFLELLDWFAAKHGATVKRRHPAVYRTRSGEPVQGSVDALLTPKTGGAGVALELDFAADSNSAYKLLDLKKSGGHSVVLVSAYGANAAEVRARVDQGFRKPTAGWLAVVHVAA